MHICKRLTERFKPSLENQCEPYAAGPFQGREEEENGDQ